MENGENVQIRGPANLKGDKQNIALLLCLYTLQGIPLGLSSAIPMILQNRGVSYKQQVSPICAQNPIFTQLLSG
jgi:PAT family acetyl-CoA transporter-like MFS transporter 1